MTWRRAGIVIAAAILVRLAVFTRYPPGDGLQAVEQARIAAGLNAGQGLVFEQYGTVYQAYKEPLYIWLLAAVARRWGQRTLLLLIFQGFFGAGVAVTVSGIARRLWGDEVRATLAGVLAAANPFLAYNDTQIIYPLSLDCWLFMAMVGSTVSAVTATGGGVRATLRAGAVMGLTLWQRAIHLAGGVAMWAAAILMGVRHARRVVLQRAAIWCGVALVIILPWFIRNYGLFHRVVMTTDSAHILWLGNNPWSNGTYSDGKGHRSFELADPAFQRRIIGASEIEQYDRFLDAVRRFVLEHPGRFLRLVLGRLRTFFWFSQAPGAMYTAGQKIVYQVAYLSLLGVGLAGFLQHWRTANRPQREEVLLMIAAILGLAAAHALVVMNLKYRVPFELLLGVFAADPLARGLRLLRARFAGEAPAR